LKLLIEWVANVNLSLVSIFLFLLIQECLAWSGVNVVRDFVGKV
jgi:hypothetical protein